MKRMRAHGAALLLLSSALRAEPAPTLDLRVNGTCPDAAHVVDRLGFALPGVRVRTDTPRLQAEISDRGPGYRVTIFGQPRDIADERRRCEERAEVAAVMLALALRPATVDEGGATPAPPVQVPAPMPALAIGPVLPAAPVSPSQSADAPSVSRESGRANGGSRRALGFTLEAGIEGALAPVATSPRAAGIDVRAVVGGDRLALVVGAAAFTTAAQSFPAGQAVTRRVPFDLGARVMFVRDRWGAALDAGPFAALLFVDGSGFTNNLSSTRVDLGLRASPSVRFSLRSRWAMTLALPVYLSFTPRDLVIDQEGTVGQTPRLWLGFAAGAAGEIF